MLAVYLPGLHIANLGIQTAIWYVGNTSPNPPPSIQEGDVKEPETVMDLIAMSIAAAKVLNVGLCSWISYQIWKHKMTIIDLKAAAPLVASSVACFLFGSLRISTYHALGKRFTYRLGVKKDASLVTDGLYKYVRHPSYSSAVVMNFATVGSYMYWLNEFSKLDIITPTVRAVLGCLVLYYPVSVSLFLVSRIEKEEKMLTHHFGPEYEAYKARTWRLIPFIY
ncbi:hypothetical protein MP638_000395 [Amoeboaphelidium occidentale]|nr:hypothetical protein MP638_000395 [Amoeboaphelidium occidentale]